MPSKRKVRARRAPAVDRERERLKKIVREVVLDVLEEETPKLIEALLEAFGPPPVHAATRRPSTPAPKKRGGARPGKRARKKRQNWGPGKSFATEAEWRQSMKDRAQKRLKIRNPTTAELKRELEAREPLLKEALENLKDGPPTIGAKEPLPEEWQNLLPPKKVKRRRPGEPEVTVRAPANGTVTATN